jgi:hypothetical protein
MTVDGSKKISCQQMDGLVPKMARFGRFLGPTTYSSGREAENMFCSCREHTSERKKTLVNFGMTAGTMIDG